MKKIIIFLMLLCYIGINGTANAQGWVNPMELPGLQANGSLGDPYIMKYRGYYYLYVSAGDRNIYCWRTKDLMEWSDRYTCCTDETTAVAYAPEVIYWNGKFYMCTSPRGGGHYILTSDSPTGPFTHQTGNMGRDIDGSFFIDDDGKWYFYHANNAGIHACDMPTHLSFGADVNLGCNITGQWTEGPCVFKRNGLYYMLYTGNHVWTNGYRIDYAISSRGPLTGFQPQKEQNPILVDTETPTHKALGHGTAFVGPDLDTYFFCYHNLQDNKSRRLLNFERIAWNGDKLMMTGPTDWEQDRPIVATNDYFERTEIGNDWNLSADGEWTIEEEDHLSQKKATGTHTALFTPCNFDSYTAEFTLRSTSSTTGSLGVITAYQDEKNYTEVLVDVATNNFKINNYVDGNAKIQRSYALPDDFDATTWHAIRVEKNVKRLRVYIDGMRKCQMNIPAEGGLNGYVANDCAADFGYTAVSPYIDGSGVLDVSLPIPGMLAANLCTEKTEDITTSTNNLSSGSYNFMKCGAGSKMTYDVNIQRDNDYNVGIRYRTTSSAVVRLLIDGQRVSNDVELPSSKSGFCVQTLRDIKMPGGHHKLTIEVASGTIYLYEYNIKRGVENPHVMADNFDEGFSPEWGYKEGNWNIVDGQLESTGRYGKMLMGGFDDIHLTDYTVECDIIYTGNGMNGGLLFRTTNASTGGADDNPVLGTDFLQGYIFFASTGGVALGKHNFGWQSLASANKEIDPNIPHHMKVEVEGPTIRCYMDDMETPLINYTDNVPFITGRAGFRTHDSSIRFDNFVITPAEKEELGIDEIATDGNLHLTTETVLYNLQGQRISTPPANGVYIIRKNGVSRKVGVSAR